MQPTFKTDRLVLRPRTLSDTEACLAMDRDPEVTRFVSGPWSDPAAHRAFIEGRTLGPYAPGLGYWTICRRDDPGSFVGWTLLIPQDTAGPEIEIGWRLRREAWGQGLAVEAASPVLRHAFVTLKLSEVVAEIDPANAASLKVAERLGLRLRGTVLHQDKPALRYTARIETFRAWRQG
jgi:RimJ/RimL family protein N-acetyltransferase